MNWQGFIHSDPDVLLGKPLIKGTRLSVELILELLGHGWSQEDLLTSYPSLTRESLSAVFLYLRDCMEQELIFTAK